MAEVPRVLGSRSAVVRLQPLSLRTLRSCGASCVELIAGFAVARSPADMRLHGPPGADRLGTRLAAGDSVPSTEHVCSQ